MTLAWAIIIVAVLFLLHKYHLLKKSLIAAAIIALALIVVVMGYFGWHYLDTQWAEHENKVRLAKENALFAQKNECLNLYTGKARPVNEPGSQTQGRQATLGTNNPSSNTAPSDLPPGAPSDLREVGKPIDPNFQVGKTIPPNSGYTDYVIEKAGSGLTQADEQWCNSNEVIHERGTPIDPWQLVGELPTIPTGDYVVTNGERDAEGNLKSPATVCDQQGQHCYAMPDPADTYGSHYGYEAKTSLVKFEGGNLLLFMASHSSINGYGALLVGGTKLALLANQGGQLTNLLPEVVLASYVVLSPYEPYRIWNEPRISPMPILVARGVEGTDVMRGTENQISSYVYDAKVRRYVLLDNYTVENHDMDKVLDREKAEILKRLKAAVDYAAPHTVTVQGAK